VNYYRAEMPAKHLPGKTVRFETRDLQPDDEGGHYFPRQQGTAIWMFPQNRLRHLLMAEMHTQGKRVLVEVDDNYTIGPPISLAGWQQTIAKSPDASYEAHMNIVASAATDAFDVMLCPLRPNRWADCKSDVKALEAAMGGACSIVSKTEPYRPWWDGSAPGYVAETKRDFLKMVKHVVANRDEVRETARLAREYAVTERNIKREIENWREAIG
jgi:hypothetical protein